MVGCTSAEVVPIPVETFVTSVFKDGPMPSCIPTLVAFLFPLLLIPAFFLHPDGFLWTIVQNSDKVVRSIRCTIVKVLDVLFEGSTISFLFFFWVMVLTGSVAWAQHCAKKKIVKRFGVRSFHNQAIQERSKVSRSSSSSLTKRSPANSSTRGMSKNKLFTPVRLSIVSKGSDTDESVNEKEVHDSSSEGSTGSSRRRARSRKYQKKDYSSSASTDSACSSYSSANSSTSDEYSSDEDEASSTCTNKSFERIDTTEPLHKGAMKLVTSSGQQQRLEEDTSSAACQAPKPPTPTANEEQVSQNAKPKNSFATKVNSVRLDKDHVGNSKHRIARKKVQQEPSDTKARKTWSRSYTQGPSTSRLRVPTPKKTSTASGEMGKSFQSAKTTVAVPSSNKIRTAHSVTPVKEGSSLTNAASSASSSHQMESHRENNSPGFNRLPGARSTRSKTMYTKNQQQMGQDMRCQRALKHLATRANAAAEAKHKVSVAWSNTKPSQGARVTGSRIPTAPFQREQTAGHQQCDRYSLHTARPFQLTEPQRATEEHFEGGFLNGQEQRHRSNVSRSLNPNAKGFHYSRDANTAREASTRSFREEPSELSRNMIAQLNSSAYGRYGKYEDEKNNSSRFLRSTVAPIPQSVQYDHRHSRQDGFYRTDQLRSVEIQRQSHPNQYEYKEDDMCGRFTNVYTNKQMDLRTIQHSSYSGHIGREDPRTDLEMLEFDMHNIAAQMSSSVLD